MFESRKAILGTDSAPRELIEIVEEMMIKYGPDGHCDGADVIAEAAYQWCRKEFRDNACWRDE